jgi:hypothetical protein
MKLAYTSQREATIGLHIVGTTALLSWRTTTPNNKTQLGVTSVELKPGFENVKDFNFPVEIDIALEEEPFGVQVSDGRVLFLSFNAPRRELLLGKHMVKTVYRFVFELNMQSGDWQKVEFNPNGSEYLRFPVTDKWLNKIKADFLALNCNFFIDENGGLRVREDDSPHTPDEYRTTPEVAAAQKLVEKYKNSMPLVENDLDLRVAQECLEKKFAAEANVSELHMINAWQIGDMVGWYVGFRLGGDSALALLVDA